METINECKDNLIAKFYTLPETRQGEIQEFYGCLSGDTTTRTIIKDAKMNADSVIEYADRKGYGYGEVGFNLNEAVKDFAEDVPELEKEYKRLLRAYFEFLIETKNI